MRPDRRRASARKTWPAWRNCRGTTTRRRSPSGCTWWSAGGRSPPVRAIRIAPVITYGENAVCSVIRPHPDLPRLRGARLHWERRAAARRGRPSLAVRTPRDSLLFLGPHEYLRLWCPKMKNILWWPDNILAGSDCACRRPAPGAPSAVPSCCARGSAAPSRALRSQQGCLTQGALGVPPDPFTPRRGPLDDLQIGEAP